MKGRHIKKKNADLMKQEGEKQEKLLKEAAERKARKEAISKNQNTFQAQENEKVSHYHLQFLPRLYLRNNHLESPFSRDFESKYFTTNESNPMVQALEIEFGNKKTRSLHEYSTPTSRIHYKLPMKSDMNGHVTLTNYLSWDEESIANIAKHDEIDYSVSVPGNCRKIAIFYYQDVAKEIEKKENSIKSNQDAADIINQVVEELKKVDSSTLSNLEIDKLIGGVVSETFKKNPGKTRTSFDNASANLEDPEAEKFKKLSHMDQEINLLSGMAEKCLQNVAKLKPQLDRLSQQDQRLQSVCEDYDGDIIVITNHSLWTNTNGLPKTLIDLMGSHENLTVIPTLTIGERVDETLPETMRSKPLDYTPEGFLLKFIQLNTKLDDYIAEREKEPEHLHFFQFWGFSKGEKLAAANALRDVINGTAEEKTLEPHLKALNQGRLSKTYQVYLEYAKMQNAVNASYGKSLTEDDDLSHAPKMNVKRF